MIGTKIEEGQAYSFVYSGVPRLAVVNADEGDLVRCWDFTRENYRSFKKRYIEQIKNVTDKQVVTFAYKTKVGNNDKVFCDGTTTYAVRKDLNE